MCYYSKKAIDHLRLQNGLSERYQRRALDVTLACKLTMHTGNIMSMRKVMEAYHLNKNFP
jgi:hypothetical protein